MELQERRAAEYALGTLPGAARAHSRRWMREDAAIARTVSEGEARLAPLAQAVSPRNPPARVWNEILARLGPSHSSPGGKGRFWRGLGLVASGAAAALVLMAVLLQRQAGPAGDGALLRDPRTQKPGLMGSAGPDEAHLRGRNPGPSLQVSDS